METGDEGFGKGEIRKGDGDKGRASKKEEKREGR